MAGRPIGTPGYMAPEQVRGDPEMIGVATDIYGLGAILYECLTGRRPFHGESAISVLYRVLEELPVPPRRVRPEIPASIERICLKCLEKDPSHRYANAGELAQALQGFLARADAEDPLSESDALPSPGAVPFESTQPARAEDRSEPQDCHRSLELQPVRADFVLPDHQPGLWDRLRSWLVESWRSRPPGRRDR